MFAVIKTGGKQYKVAKDDIIRVEKLDAAAGDTITLEDVLMVADAGAQTVGTPLVSGASVAATVLDQARADKIIVFKKRRRKDYQRKRGHQQDLTVLRVTDILTEGRKAPVRKTAAQKAASAEEQSQASAEKPAAKPAGDTKTSAKKGKSKE